MIETRSARMMWAAPAAAALWLWLSPGTAFQAAGGTDKQPPSDRRQPSGADDKALDSLADGGEVPITEPQINTEVRKRDTLSKLDGTMVVDRRGTVERDAESGWSLLTFEKDPDLPAEKPRWLLPNRLLQAIEPIVDGNPRQVYRVTGETTVYEGQLYLLLRKVTIEATQASKAEPPPRAPSAGTSDKTAADKSAPAKRPTSDDILQDLLRSRPGKPVIPSAGGGGTEGEDRKERPAPSSSPATRPAPAGGPADRGRPSSEDILNDLMQDRPDAPAKEPSGAADAEPTPGPQADRAGAAAKPEPATRPGSQDILKELMRDRPGEPVVVPSASSEQGLRPVPSVAPRTSDEVLPPARGRMVTDRLVRVVPAGVGAWQEARFEADNTLLEPPMRLLPCRMLAKALRLSAGGKAKLRVSGEATLYHGRRYLLLRKLLLQRDLGKF